VARKYSGRQRSEEAIARRRLYAREYARRRRLADPEAHNAKCLRYWHRTVEKAVAVLGGECAQCGASEQLEFDHVVPVGSDRPTKRVELRRVVKGDVTNLQLLCKACHREKTNAERK
jgi:5-methylcytosine-specific restriction endonuclease McrA